jgi:aminomethyltransferase
MGLPLPLFHTGTGSNVLKTTPLHDQHLAAGARMVDFGGWDMPVHYGSQLDEHHAVRRYAGMFDVSHMLTVDIEGEGSRDFLWAALANNVDKLSRPGKAMYTCLLNERGGVVDDLICTYFSDTHFRLVVNAGCAGKDLAWLESLSGMLGLALDIHARRDLAMVAVQGPLSPERLWEAMSELRVAGQALKPFSAALVGKAMIARTGYTGEDGFEVTLPAERAEELWESLLAARVAPCGLGARDTLRLEAGMNLYGQDMDEDTSPLDAGLAWTVDLTGDRDFLGRKALELRGKTRDFVGLVLLDRGGVLRAHQGVTTAAGEGEVTSGSFSPSLEKSIALARVPPGTAIGSTVHVRVRDKELAARVVKPPFVRKGQPLV